jgi:CRP/FNR family transcriptional regulator, cyclic AMP receptor protein
VEPVSQGGAAILGFEVMRTQKLVSRKLRQLQLPYYHFLSDLVPARKPAMSATPAIIADVPMFSLLDPNECATLAQLVDTQHFQSGQNVFVTGDAGGSLYIVHSGLVELYTESTEGEKIVLDSNGQGDVFGEISLLDGGPRNATAVAVQDTDLLVLDRDGVFNLVKEHPHAALDLLTAVGHRLRHTDELLRTHVTRNANVEEQDRLTFGQRVADRMGAFGGSWTFIGLFGLLLISWIVMNTVLLVRHAFDPYPFIFLNLVLSMVAAIQAPVIMMSQNRQATKDRLKSDLDYKINLKAELEVAALHSKVDRMYEALQEHWAEYEKLKKNQADLQELAR